jgi:hypothetical protein
MKYFSFFLSCGADEMRGRRDAKQGKKQFIHAFIHPPTPPPHSLLILTLLTRLRKVFE